MHQAALLGESIQDAKSFGWEIERENVKHNWGTLVQGVQDYVRAFHFLQLLSVL